MYIPTWKDTVAWARRDPELIAQLKTGYPRFFVPLVVDQLAERLLEWAFCNRNPNTLTSELSTILSTTGRAAILLPAGHHARMCQRYLDAQNMGATFVLKVDFNNGTHIMKTPEKTCNLNEIYAVVYPSELAKDAKAFWQHTGFGVSSRRATSWLEDAPFLNQDSSSSATDLPNQDAETAKLVVQQRIADLLSTETNSLDVDDVFLYPSGMSAIAHTADTVRYFTTPTKRTVAIFGYVILELAATPCLD